MLIQEKKLKKNQKSIEHIVPHSKKGPNTISNYLVVDKKINEVRGCMLFVRWLETFPEAIKNIQVYLDKYKELMVEDINYVNMVKPTLNKEAKGLITFTGKQICTS